MSKRESGITPIGSLVASAEDALETIQATCACGAMYDARRVRATRNVVSPRECPLCLDKRAAQLQERERLAAERAQADKRRHATEMFDVWPKYRAASLATMRRAGTPAQQARQLAIETEVAGYVEHWPHVPSLLLFASHVNGAGKTFAAWAIANHLVRDQSVLARVITCADLIAELRAPFNNREAPPYEVVLGTLRREELLIIDEVSLSSFYGRPIYQDLYNVLNDRDVRHDPENGVPRATILTTHEGDEGIREILGRAIYSRLSGSGGLLDFGDFDFRTGL